MKIQHFAFQKIEAFENRLYSHPLHKDPKLEELYKRYEDKAKVNMCAYYLAFTFRCTDRECVFWCWMF